MKKLIFIILVFSSFFLLGKTQLKAEGVYNISQYFPLDIDNTWIYRAMLVRNQEKNVDISVSSIREKDILDGKDIYVLEVDLNERPFFCYSEDKDGIYLHKMIEDENYSIFFPPAPIFTNQMQLDKENIFSGKAKLYNIKDELIEEYKMEIKNKLESIEDVTVPAGKFQNCLKINLSINYYKRKHTMTVKQTIWLAKNVGKVKEQNEITVYNGEPHIYCNFLELEKAIVRKK